MESEIRLSSNEFKALSSETRTNIIKLLKERNHTLTEISKKLRLAAPTIKQHLGVLLGAELVQELDEGRKWKYYCLTRKSKNIFVAETPINVFIVLAVSVFALVGMLYSFVSAIGIQAVMATGSRGEAFIGVAENVAEGGAIAGASESIAAPAMDGAAKVLEQEAAAVVPLQPELMALLLAIVAVSMIAGFFAARAKRR